ncbi:MAG: hypothetical protein F6J96_12665 [Symploca sp. SIO1C2]|nr:hypothetical protein [Symploca sp. SIO1C2]
MKIITYEKERDGTHQYNRQLPELEPDYVAVDERLHQDWLAFAQEFAKELKYFDDNDQHSGDWAAFFEQVTVEDAIAFLNDPDSFLVTEPAPANLTEAEAQARERKKQKYLALSQPHFVLFLTFLKLLEYPQQQFRNLNPRYLEYYYQKVLQLTTKPETPDQVHVTFTLASGYPEPLIKKGTLLKAGKDSQGKELNYATNEDLIVNQTQVASIKTIAVETEGAEGAGGAEGTHNVLAQSSRNLTQNFVHPDTDQDNSSDRQKIRNIYARTIEAAAAGSETTAKRFKTFQPRTLNDSTDTASIGFAITSPLLHLEEGERVITLTLTCLEGTFNQDSLGEEIPFEFYLSNSEEWIQLKAEAVEFNSEEEQDPQNPNQKIPILKFTLTLDALQPAITAPKASPAEITSPYPVVKIVLKPQEDPKNYRRKTIAYQEFKDLRIEKVKIEVDVQGVKTIKGRNDTSTVDTKGVFEPFGNRPQPGSGFYLANPEISAKPLQSLKIHWQWMGLPKKFADYYQGYQDLDLMSDISNSSFKAQLRVLNNRSLVDVEAAKSIFASDNTGNLNQSIELSYTDFKIKLDPPALATEADDPLEWQRYFKLELNSPDFGHELYPVAQNKVALASDPDTKNLTINPPYTPKVKSISLDYTTSVEIDLTNPTATDANSQIFQLHPFGYHQLVSTQDTRDSQGAQGEQHKLLPQFNQEGYLLIGLRGLHPPQDISLLFQLIAGSANTDADTPKISWSYLSNDDWKDFKPTEILTDTTDGLVDSGIIRFTIPTAATTTHQVMDSGLHWIRATVEQHGDAIPDTLDIKAQAIALTYVNQGNAADHLSQPLPPNSIQELKQRIPAIQTVNQPYSSFKGKQQENPRSFNTRVSERLRHKQRAITPWDYEHIVLENFPEIYKVKCIRTLKPGSSEVEVVVVPDIRNVAPFFPLEPKAPLYLLKEIEAYLKACSSPFVKLKVKNPDYERILYRIGVKFRAGYEQGYYLKQINEDLKRFLSPWAYGNQAELTFGSSIHSSSVIYFLEKLPYVDYVTNIKLVKQATGDKEYPILDTKLAQVHHPDAILVSEPEQIIDLITKDQYEAGLFEGIGYMLIGLDFIVTNEFGSIGYMIIGNDFKVTREVGSLGYMLIGTDFIVY